MNDQQFMNYVKLRVVDGLKPLVGNNVDISRDIRSGFDSKAPYSGLTADIVLGYLGFNGDIIAWGAVKSIAAPSEREKGRLATTERYVKYEGLVPEGQQFQLVTYVFDASGRVVRVEAPEQDAGIDSHIEIRVGNTLDDTIAAIIDYASNKRIPSSLIA